MTPEEIAEKVSPYLKLEDGSDIKLGPDACGTYIDDIHARFDTCTVLRDCVLTWLCALYGCVCVVVRRLRGGLWLVAFEWGWLLQAWLHHAAG